MIKGLPATSKVHTAFSTTDDNIVLIDGENMHVLKYNRDSGYIQKFATHGNMFIKCAILFENHYLYVLYSNKLNSNSSVAEKQSNSNGFGIIDVASL